MCINEKGGEIRKVTLPKVATVCKRCGETQSTEWWKCCLNHTSEQGPDVVCERCAFLMHPGYVDEKR